MKTSYIDLIDQTFYFPQEEFDLDGDNLTFHGIDLMGLIEKYGEPSKTESGAPTFVIKMDSPEFKAFCDELAPFNEMSHEVELMTAKYEDAIGNLSGEEILAIDWMLED